MMCVTGTPQVEDALFRADGVLAGMKPSMIVIDCSTAIPASTRAVAVPVIKANFSPSFLWPNIRIFWTGWEMRLWTRASSKC